jgi:hypothetical protein
MSATPTQEAGSGTGVVAARCAPTGSWSWPGGERPAGASSARPPWTSTLTGRKRQPTTCWRRKIVTNAEQAGLAGRAAPLKLHQVKLALTVVIPPGLHGRLSA